ncbi:ABC transporter substrate-binding protein [Propylenella binzhouense]|uniref:ABC transporter substrate-binding protein n=1 Tax=Propylenella binzhouense TaxID=2555902 RepID=A0A964T3B3_9HYPH|nr:ABC transporter substrate-binding protein [Propylenella binzhouense]MYZ47668.1 ABC transporter substrate-binding protein [Propylenella binzhouense]
MLRQRGLLAAVGLAVSIGLTAPALAVDLTVGATRGTPSIDPHFQSSIVNYEHNINIFEPLVRFNNNNKIEPWLAESWKVVDDTTWEFKIRPNVKWHDGSPLTAEDIAFTYKRAQNVPNSPSPLTNYLRQIKETQVVDDHTLRVITKGPAPTLLNFLVSVLIVSKKHGENATTEDYHTGKAMIGTGPYTFESWSPNDRMVMVRNEDYWGPKPPWDKLTYLGMPNDASRIAAVLSGDIDVALSLPPTDVERLKKDSRVNVYDRPANRLVFMAVDVNPEALDSGKITGPNGEKLTENPLANKKVRQALELSINLDAFVDRVYRGLALATGQYLQEDMFGYIPGLDKWQYDEAKAKQLLEESGWAGKFKLTLATSDSAFRLSIPAVQALAQSWSRIGVPTDVTIMPHPVFLQERNDRKLPIYLASWTNPAGRAEDLYLPILHSRDPKAGFGTLNMARYSNPKVDKLIEEGLTTMDDAKREALFVEAGRIAMDDAVMVPLWMPSEAVATRKGITYDMRADGLNFVQNIKPEK